MYDIKIVIVGAGASGIACATKLIEFGFKNVLILEAEGRIGGRIQSVPFAENVIDLGAQWCHGEKKNVIYKIAQQCDLLETEGTIYDRYQCIRSNRDILPEKISHRLKKIVNGTLVSRQLELRNTNESIGSFLRHAFYEQLQRSENRDIETGIATEFLKNYEKFENSVEASDCLDDVSGPGYLEYWECEGELLLNWKGKGFIQFLKLLMRASVNGSDFGILTNRIWLSKKVEKIQWNRKDRRVAIKYNTGKILADHVVVTMSLGVLKQEISTIFDPKLPKRKERAINGISFGAVNKIFIEFSQAFWPEDWTGFTMLWRNEDLKEIQGTPRAWLEDIFGFYCVKNQKNVLNGWIVGEKGRYMETLSDEEVLNGCMYLLRKFLPWNVTNPVRIKFSKWHTNDNFRGSYSFRSIKTDKIGSSARDLAEPLEILSLIPEQLKSEALPITNVLSRYCHKPIVQFAGEATSEHFYSTVHGAVESGWREAIRINDFYQKYANEALTSKL